MQKIVDKGIKIDLHIHSIYSNIKDGIKVANNTLENIPILVSGLLEQGVNLCAITDHDAFNLELYRKLKEEELKENCIEKVLPGVEFSVEFEPGKLIHIITIFDDKNEQGIERLNRIMNEGLGKSEYKQKIKGYSKNSYFNVLESIGADFVMIAHQKKTISSTQKPHANDVLSLGKDKFNEFLFTDYFDAYEFRNKRNEIYNKTYLIENNVEDKLRFITGSDCHMWSYYPSIDDRIVGAFPYTYIKSLATFKGVAMAITDYRRISMQNTFFNPTSTNINHIILKIDGQEVQIPLSKGINVIIGDNSIGKSLFLHALTENQKLPKGVLKGYEKYLSKNHLEIQTKIPEKDIFMFNSQGEVRGIFDQGNVKPNKYLSRFYPEEIAISKYREIIEGQVNLLYEELNKKFEYDKNVKELPAFRIPVEEIDDTSIVFVGEAKKIDMRDIQILINQFDETINSLGKLLESPYLKNNDKKHIETTNEMIKSMSIKYSKEKEQCLKENQKINSFTTYINEYKSEYRRKTTDEHAVYSDFIESKKKAEQNIYYLLYQQSKLKKFEINIDAMKVVPNTNPVDKYKFVSKIQIELIDDKYIQGLIAGVLKKDKKINTTTITEQELKSYIKNYPLDDVDRAPLAVLKEKIQNQINKDLEISNTIVDETMEVYEEVSAGFDAQMFFTLLCGEIRDKGIYIIDQPEDHISQRAIKDKILGQFKKMGQQRQVLMVTHNPQFIVNLDVDNVIFLSKDNGEFNVKSGALEYEDKEYNVLNIVAENIDGGLQTIMGRMKRYEKNISI